MTQGPDNQKELCTPEGLLMHLAMASDLVARTLTAGTLALQRHLSWAHLPMCQYIDIHIYNGTRMQ